MTSNKHSVLPTAREVIVRFRESALTEWDDRGAQQLVSQSIATLGDDAEGAVVERVFDRDDLAALAARRSHDSHRQPRRRPVFGRSYFVTLREDASSGALFAAAKVLGQLDHVFRSVEIAWPGREPAVLPTADALWPHEGHIEGALAAWVPYSDGAIMAPEHVHGTNAWYAWRFPGGDGRDVSFIDVERGWDLAHPDLVDHDIQLIVGRASNKTGRVQHGTRSLGVVCARDESGMVVGVAPRLSYVAVASYRRRRRNRKGVVQRIERTITKAALHLGEGDVLLLEVELVESAADRRPVESRSSIFEAIRDVTETCGVVVVEPAGNGAQSIDGMLHGESGAIVVGAAMEETPHERMGGSNFGDRVDCWSWGNRVTTCDHQDAPAPPYTGRFDGTSSAAAIVAGIAAAVQGAHKSAFGTVLTPEEMRSHLSSGPTAAVVMSGAPARVGTQPDVRHILDERLGLPFPWVRDSDADKGLPGIALVHASPDMVWRAQGVAIGTLPFVDDVLNAGDAATLHLRVFNRAPNPAKNVEIDVYWKKAAAAASSSVTFDGWTYCGTANIDIVPANGHAEDASISVDHLPEAPGAMDLLAVLRHDALNVAEHRLPSGSVPDERWRTWLDRLRTTAYRRADAGMS